MANQNKIGIVTGGSKGIGQSISIGLSQKNIDVIITYLRDKDGALSTSNEIKKTGANCHIYKVDLSKEDQVEKLCDDVKNNFNHLNSLKGKDSSEWREYATKCMVEIMDNKG